MEEKKASIAIQDPDVITCAAYRSGPTLENVPLDFVTPVPTEFYHGKGICNEIISLKKNNIIKGLEVKLISDGHRFLGGGKIETGYFFTEDEIKKLGEKYLPQITDQKEFQWSVEYKKVQETWLSRLLELLGPTRTKEEKFACKNNLYQAVIRLNLTLEDTLEHEVTIEKEVEKKGRFNSKKKVKIHEKYNRFKSFLDSEEKSCEVVTEYLAGITKLFEEVINNLYVLYRRGEASIGDIQLAYGYNRDGRQLINPNYLTRVKSWDISSHNGVTIYDHYTGIGGKFKVEGNTSESKNEEIKPNVVEEKKERNSGVATPCAKIETAKESDEKMIVWNPKVLATLEGNN